MLSRPKVNQTYPASVAQFHNSSALYMESWRTNLSRRLWPIPGNCHAPLIVVASRNRCERGRPRRIVRTRRMMFWHSLNRLLCKQFPERPADGNWAGWPMQAGRRTSTQAQLVKSADELGLVEGRLTDIRESTMIEAGSRALLTYQPVCTLRRKRL